MIGIYRPIVEFWGNRFVKRTFRRSFWKAVRTWTDYNYRLVEILERRRELGQPYLLLHYKSLMQQEDEFQRLEAFIGRKLVDNRKPDLYRSNSIGKRRIDWTDRFMNWVGLPQPSLVDVRLRRLRSPEDSATSQA